MDSLNTIPNSGSFGDVSAKLNDNFSKVGQSLTTLENVVIANKGYFDTLASLQAAFPSPKAGNIAYVADVASSTGYYIYNVVAGVWTATTTEAPAVDVAISDYAQHGYSSSPKTLKQVEDELAQLAGELDEKFSNAGGKNLFNINSPDVLLGQYYSNNVLMTDARFNQSGYITVVSGLVYTSSERGFSIEWYNSSKEHIYTTSSSSYTNNITAPANAVYARFICSVEGWANFQVEQAAVPTAYEPYRSLLNKDYIPELSTEKIQDLSITHEKIKNLSVTPEKTTFFKVAGKNLFNPNTPDILFGKYYENNVLKTNADFNQTGLIPVVPGEKYTATDKGFLVEWYNDSGEYLTTTPSVQFVNYVTAPAGSAFARFIGNAATWSTFQVEKNTASTPYEPYRFILDIKLTSDIFGLKWTSFGDSITAQEKWQPYIIEKTGLTHTNCGVGSSCIAGSARTPNDAMWTAERLQAVKDSNPDILTILGGANDLAYSIAIGSDTEMSTKDTSTFLGAYNHIISDLLTWKPSLKIILLTTTWAHNDGADLHTTLRYSMYADATKKIARLYGLPVADLHSECGFNALTKSIYIPDDIHPNELGGKRIADVVVQKLRTI